MNNHKSNVSSITHPFFSYNKSNALASMAVQGVEAMNGADSSSGNGTGIRDQHVDDMLISLAQAEHNRHLKGKAVADDAKKKNGRWLLPAVKKYFDKKKKRSVFMTHKACATSEHGARSLEYIVTDGSGTGKKSYAIGLREYMNMDGGWLDVNAKRWKFEPHCECGWPEVFGIACDHIQFVCEEEGIPLYTQVSLGSSAAKLVEQYDEMGSFPVRGTAAIEEDMKPTNMVMASIKKAQAGRPSKKRIKSAMDHVNKVKQKKIADAAKAAESPVQPKGKPRNSSSSSSSSHRNSRGQPSTSQASRKKAKN